MALLIYKGKPFIAYTFKIARLFYEIAAIATLKAQGKACGSKLIQK